MGFRSIVILALLACLQRPTLVDSASVVIQESGTIAGHIRDANNGVVSDVMVVVCDEETGIPIDRQTYQPFTNGDKVDLENILTTNSDRDGYFSIQNLPRGNYRLLAQTWENVEPVPTKPLEKNGRIIRLHGIAEIVNVPSQDAEVLDIRPLGNCSLDINTRPSVANNSVLLVISREPMAADPILGFTGWSGSFLQQMVAWNRMMLGKTTVHGLPPGKFHLAAFANDNNPGFGGIAIDINKNKSNRVTIPLVASWSNGVREPPPELVPLIRRIEKVSGSAVEKFIGGQYPEIIDKRDNLKSPMEQMWGFWIPYLERTVQVEDVDVPIKDLIAAEGYLGLERHAKQMLERRKQAALKKMEIDPNVTYADAIRELHQTLESRYPCFELKQIDWKAVGQRLLPQAEKITNDQEFGLLCMELVAALEDSHAQLLTAAAQLPRAPLPGWDAGLACLEDDRGKPVVYFVVPGSAAESAGIKIGMTVEAIDGKDANQPIQDTMKLYRRYIGYSSEQYLRYHAFRFFTRQFEPGDFELTVTDVDGKQHQIALKADQSPGYVNRLPVTMKGIPDSANLSWKMLADNIGYIYVRRIKGPNLIAKLDQAVDQLRDADGLIIDVRGNSGGGFDYHRAHRNFDPDMTNEPERPRFLNPMAVLIDSRCISAGEGWASWFQANDRARFFGQATAGASARKTTYTMTNGLYHVRYPVKAYKGYLDRPIERIGLEPDVVIRQNVADLTTGRDTVLKAARQHLIDVASETTSD